MTKLFTIWSMGHALDVRISWIEINDMQGENVIEF